MKDLRELKDWDCGERFSIIWRGGSGVRGYGSGVGVWGLEVECYEFRF